MHISFWYFVVPCFLRLSFSDFCIYVISTLGTLFWQRCSPNYTTLTQHATHNMELHVQSMTCLYKTTDSALDQLPLAIAMPSRSPWKPVFSGQWGSARGGVWIEVARRARRFASGLEPEKAGEDPLTTVRSRLLDVSYWGILDVWTEYFTHCSVFIVLDTQDDGKGDFFSAAQVGFPQFTPFRCFSNE